jgi:predicted DNA-binding transcriptional regulator YafY
LKFDRPDADRRIRQADRLARILRVLRLVDSPGRLNADQIAGELGVSRRTVLRDIKTLEFAGVPIFYDRNRNSYEIRSDYGLTVPKLTTSEIVGQTIAAVIARAAGVDATGTASSATSKIAAVASEDDQQLFADAREVLSAISLQFVDHTGHEQAIQTVQQALLTNRCLQATYRSPYQQNSICLTLAPVRLCLIKQALYLIAVPGDANQPKTYRIARFESVELTAQPAKPIPNFDLHDYLGNAWAVFRGSESYDVSIRFNPTAAKIVTETTWHRTQRADASDDGSVILHFTVDGLDEIGEWLLTWTGQAEVIAPQELRTMLVQRLQAGLQLNDSPQCR